MKDFPKIQTHAMIPNEGFHKKIIPSLELPKHNSLNKKKQFSKCTNFYGFYFFLN